MHTRGWEEEMLRAIKRPQIPERSFSIVDFGAKPGSEEIQTDAIQQTIDYAYAHGGGSVVVPAGRFLTGALRLKSHVALHLATGDSMLAFSTDTRDYPMVFCHWECTPCYNYSPLIYAIDAQDIAITGCGVLDGQACDQTWWNWHHQMENDWSKEGKNLQEKARMALRRMNEEGVPVEKRSFGDGCFLRPNFIQMLRCERVLLQGITLRNSPMWQVNPVQCTSVTVEGLTLDSHGPNNDGVDPESCNGVLIQGCTFNTGDDCISLKSGRDRDGRMANMPCQNVVIRENRFADGHGGVALGSEASGGIRNVIVHHNCFNSPRLTYALRLKTNARRGGVMENIWFHHCDITQVECATLHGTMLYEDGARGSFLPVFRNIVVEDITACGGEYGIFLEAFPQVPIKGLCLRRISIRGAAHGLYGRHWDDPVLEDVKINGQAYPRPTQVRIMGIPLPGAQVDAWAWGCGGPIMCSFQWLIEGEPVGEGPGLVLPLNAQGKRLEVLAYYAPNGEIQRSHPYCVLSEAFVQGNVAARLYCRGIWNGTPFDGNARLTRRELACLLQPFGCHRLAPRPTDVGEADAALQAIQAAVGTGRLALDSQGNFQPDNAITRQEMATVVMRSCGVSYRNASTTAPDCADMQDIRPQYATNVARSLYYGFQTLDEDGAFHPQETVTWTEAMDIINRVADFAGL